VEPGKLANKIIYLREELGNLSNWWFDLYSQSGALYAFEAKHGCFVEEMDTISGKLKVDAVQSHYIHIKEQAKRQRQSRKINNTKLMLIRSHMVFLADYAGLTAENLVGRRMNRLRNNICTRMRFFAGYCEAAAAKIIRKKQ
jgi:hypothetical protein